MRLVKGPKLKMSQKVEKVQVSAENQKVQNSKFGLFDKRVGGVQIFLFSQIQMHTLDTSVEEKIS